MSAQVINGWTFLGITTLIALGVFLNGLRFARMHENPFKGRKLFGMPVEGHDLPVERIRLIGILQMVFAPLFLLFIAALCFGLFGPVEGIELIHM